VFGAPVAAVSCRILAGRSSISAFLLPFIARSEALSMPR
jgi:hypothetical protein